MPVKSLSGGNIQKLIIGREIESKPALLVASHPTYGLDIGATEYIRKQILNRREEGGGVLLVSEDLEELFEICDRIAVIFKGEFMGVLSAGDSNIKDIGLMMTGSLKLDDKNDGHAENKDSAGTDNNGAEKLKLTTDLMKNYKIDVAPRGEVKSWVSSLIALISLLAGLSAIGFIFLLKGINPFYAIYRIFSGSFGSMYGFRETITKGDSAYSYSRRTYCSLQREILEYRSRRASFLQEQLLQHGLPSDGDLFFLQVL